jgi:tetraacyldisaccharide 4'-kinase
MVENVVFRILLYPFSLVYMGILGIRNMLYDADLLKSTKFNLPVISVGNLAIGGAGKTPHVEYLIRLLRPYLELGVLSRGYKRKSKGFRLVNPQDNADISGDEPKQYAMKYPDIAVAVAESRNTGIPELLKLRPEINTIILDDAYQHRSVTPYLNILLTAYELVYTEDYLLPAGRLREYASASDRADRIIVTKCPQVMEEYQRQGILDLLQAEAHQQVYFSYYKYYTPYYMYDGRQKLTLTPDREVILLAAIANTTYLENYLSKQCTVVNTIKFEDHHYFSERDIEMMVKIFQQEDQKECVILTTEKDATRLHLHSATILKHKLPIFILPLEVDFHFGEKAKFDQDIKDFLLEFKS